MIYRAIFIGSWEVYFAFAVDGYDIERVLSFMRDCNAPKSVLVHAEELMAEGNENCGFTYANQEIKRAIVVIGPTTGGSEFIDTMVHEVHHLAVAIASGLGLDLESETPAYIAGDSVRALAEIICALGCPDCDKWRH